MVSQPPAVSVLVPTFNAACTIQEALLSVQLQSASDFECLIVDDGSVDDSRQIAEAFCARDTRFLLLPGAHEGIVATLNRGLAQCRGQYVARFDADDLMTQHRLKLQRDALEAEPELAGVGSHVELFPREILSERRVAYETWLNSVNDADTVFRERFVECPLAHPTLFLRREHLARFAYRDMPWAEDYDLVLRLLGAGCRLGTVPEVLLRWRDSRERLSRTAERYCLSQFVECKARFLADDWLGSSEHYVLWGYGSTGKALCRALAKLGRTPTSIVEVHPRRIGQRISGVLVVAPTAIGTLPASRGKLVVCVAGDGPRTEVRTMAKQLGLVEGRDYVCAA